MSSLFSVGTQESYDSRSLSESTVASYTVQRSVLKWFVYVNYYFPTLICLSVQTLASTVLRENIGTIAKLVLL